MPPKPSRPERARPVILSVPEEILAAEIEFAIAYTVACNGDRRYELLRSASSGGRRADFACAIAAMLLERAGNGLSGMSLAPVSTEPG